MLDNRSRIYALAQIISAVDTSRIALSNRI